MRAAPTTPVTSPLVGPHSASPAALKARLDAERMGTPFLILRDGDEQQRLVELDATRARLTVGRSPDCDIAIGWDGQASRTHAQLERIGRGWAVVDGGLSRNGTFLNGERLLERRRLRDGDLLRFGQTAVVYREPGPDDPAKGQTETARAQDVPAAAPVTAAQRAVVIALCRPFADGRTFAAPATNGQIARELSLSVDAVKAHLRVVFVKFGIDGLPQNEKRLRLAECVLRAGLVTPADLRG